MSKIAINKERVIENAKAFGLKLEYDSQNPGIGYAAEDKKHFLRFRHPKAEKYDTRFAIVVYLSQDLSDIADKHIYQFQEALIDVGKYLKEQEIITALGLQPKEDMPY